MVAVGDERPPAGEHLPGDHRQRGILVQHGHIDGKAGGLLRSGVGGGPAERPAVGRRRNSVARPRSRILKSPSSVALMFAGVQVLGGPRTASGRSRVPGPAAR